MHLGDAERAGDSVGRFAAIASRHNDLEAERLQLPHRVAGRRFDWVGDGEQSFGAVVDRDEQRALAVAGHACRIVVEGASIDAEGFEEARIADCDALSANGSLSALTADRLESGDG